MCMGVGVCVERMSERLELAGGRCREKGGVRFSWAELALDLVLSLWDERIRS